jgi:hypothetical protein
MQLKVIIYSLFRQTQIAVGKEKQFYGISANNYWQTIGFIFQQKEKEFYRLVRHLCLQGCKLY